MSKKKNKKPKYEKIYITYHAIEQYKARVQELPVDDIEKILREIAVNGRIIKTISVCFNRENEIHSANMKLEYKGIAIVVIYIGDQATVVTCLGDMKLRNWYFKVEVSNRNKMVS